MKRITFVWIAFAWVALTLCAQTPAVPVEPVTAILDAFRTHEIVALGNVEFRGNEQSHAFQLSLIRDPRFAATVNDILVEFGSIAYQDVADRFLRGEDVPQSELRHIWQDTTQFEIEWDLPIYEDFYRAVRALNASLPPARRLRVLLGDPAVDWNAIHNLRDLLPAVQNRDAHAVEVLRREVLAKGRRALVLYGGYHLTKGEKADGIVARLERENLARVYTVIPETRRDLTALQPDIASWPVPSLAMVRGTPLANHPADALLYLGQPSSMTVAKPSASQCADTAYLEMRLGRLALAPPPRGAPSSLADQLKALCTALGSAPTKGKPQL